MSTWLIVPRDPLIFRDGKPFTAVPGERSESLFFPFPATIAGAVRTQAGTNPNTGVFQADDKKIQELKNIQVRGPLLVEVSHEGKILEWFYPSPADALLVEQVGNAVWRYSLAPIEMPTGASSDMDGLDLLGPNASIKNKPFKDAPHFWRWQQMEAWLTNPADGLVDPVKLGIRGPARENRTHVSISANTKTAVSGALFQTSGLEFMEGRACQLGLALDSSASIKPGMHFLGGERRVADWQSSDGKLPSCPPAVKQNILKTKHCRLVLATPAYFENGYLPAYLQTSFGIKVDVKAAGVDRYQTISGWDYEKRSPKPTRRLVPAGSIYFLALEGAEQQIEKWVDSVWMNPISDDDQSRRDGFGLALLGTWDGKARKMEVK